MVTNGVPVEVEPSPPDMLELTAKTEAGARLVLLAETLARGARAARGRARPRGDVPARQRRRAQARRLLRRADPRRARRAGVTSVHDVVVASSRLARADASVAIGVNMHLVVVLNIVRRWQAAVAGDERAAAFGASMEGSPATASSAPPRSRARAGPHPPGTTARRARDGLADRRPQGVLHGSPAATAPTPRSRSSRGRRRALRLRDGAGRTPTASRCTATGTRSACAPPAATRSRSTPWRSRARRCAAASPPATPTATWTAT